MSSKFSKRLPYNPPQHTAFDNRKTDDALIINLFLKIDEGNYSEIKKFFLTEHMTAVFQNENGESVIHAILKNPLLSQIEQKDLIQLAVKLGANVNTSDNNKITPLHLACKLQLYIIVSTLIGYGADVNATDTQNKTPLFYAIIGYNVDCALNTKQRQIIPKQNHVIEAQHYADAYKEINEILSNVEIKKHITQILTFLENIPEIYQLDIDRLLTEYKQELTKIYISQISDSDKFSKTQKLSEKLKQDVYDFIKKNINIAPLDIKPNITDGWSPDGKNEHKVLPYNEPLYYLTQAQIDLDKSRKDLNLNTIDGDLNKLFNTYDLLDTEIKIYYCQIVDLLLIYDAITNKKNKQTTIAEIKSSASVDIKDDNFFNFHIIPKIEFNRKYLPYKPIIDPNDIQSIQKDIPDTLKIFWSPTIFAQQKNSTKYPFFYSVDNGNNQLNLASINKKQELFVARQSDVPHFFYNSIKNAIRTWQKEGNKIFFTELIRYNIIIIKKNISKIIEYINEIKNGTEMNHEYINLYSIIPYLLSVLICLQNLNLELPKQIAKIQQIKSTLSTFDISLNKDIANLKKIVSDSNHSLLSYKDKNSFNFVKTTMYDIFTDFEQWCAKFQSTIDAEYKIMYNLYVYLNKHIEYISKQSAYNVFNSYFYTEDDKFFDTNITNSATTHFNFVDQPLQQLKLIPPTFNEFNELIIGKKHDINLLRKFLVETYFPQITHNYYPTFYVINNKSVNIPRIGFLTGINLTDSSKDKEWYITLEHPIEYILTNNDGIDGKIDAPDKKRGRIGKKTYLTFNYGKMNISSIGAYLANFINNIKYKILIYILKNLKSKFLDNISKLNENMKTLLKFDSDDYSFIYSFVAKYVDKVLIYTIENSLATQANNITLQLLRNLGKKHYDKLPNFLIIPPTDDKFDLSLDEISYITGVNAGALFLYGDLIDEQTTAETITEYSVKNPRGDQLCFRVNTTIIDHLIKNGANINAQDIIGNTVAHYAIDMSLSEIYRKLKETGLLRENISNSLGETPKTLIGKLFKEALKSYKEQYIDDKELLYPLAKLLSEFTSNETNNRQIPKYTSILLPFMLYIFNMDVLISNKTSVSAYIFSDSSLNVQSSSNTAIMTQISKLLEQIVKNKTEQLQPIDSTSKEQLGKNRAKLVEDLKQAVISYIYDDEAIKKVMKLIYEATNKIKQHSGTVALGGVKTAVKTIKKTVEKTIESEVKTTDAPIAIDEIIKSVKAVKASIIKETTNATTNAINEVTKVEGAFDGTTTEKVKEAVGEVKEAVVEVKKAVEEVETVISKSTIATTIQSSALRTLEQNTIKTSYTFEIDVMRYPLAVKKYFGDLPSTDSIFTFITQLGDQSKIPENDTNIDKYYKYVNKFSDDYFVLPQEYKLESNYAMIKIIDIIIHIVRNIMMPNLYATIVKAIVKWGGIYGIHKGNYERFVKNIVETQIDGKNLLDYIFDTLPKKLVKNILQIYEDEFDTDKINDNLLLFDEITKYITYSIDRKITLDSTLIQNVQPIYRYFTEYFEIFIKGMKDFIDEYMRTIQQQMNIAQMKL